MRASVKPRLPQALVDLALAQELVQAVEGVVVADEEDLLDVVGDRRKAVGLAGVALDRRLGRGAGLDPERRVARQPGDGQVVQLLEREDGGRQLHRAGGVEVLVGEPEGERAEGRAVLLVPVDLRVQDLEAVLAGLLQHGGEPSGVGAQDGRQLVRRSGGCGEGRGGEEGQRCAQAAPHGASPRRPRILSAAARADSASRASRSRSAFSSSGSSGFAGGGGAGGEPIELRQRVARGGAEAPEAVDDPLAGREARPRPPEGGGERGHGGTAELEQALDGAGLVSGVLRPQPLRQLDPLEVVGRRPFPLERAAEGLDVRAGAGREPRVEAGPGVVAAQLVAPRGAEESLRVETGERARDALVGRDRADPLAAGAVAPGDAHRRLAVLRVQLQRALVGRDRLRDARRLEAPVDLAESHERLGRPASGFAVSSTSAATASCRRPS